ncbi:Enoyl-CoA hydratase 2, peroxisomal-like protein [Drosera capensis]
MARIDPHLVISHKFPEATYRYTERRDAALYAVGIGACATDALDADELRFVYQEDGQQFVKVFPTFDAVVLLEPLGSISAIPGME